MVPIPRSLIAFVTGLATFAALAGLPSSAAAAADSVSFVFGGGKTYSTAGQLEAGDVKVFRSGSKLTAIHAAGKIPGAASGSASFTIQLERGEAGPFFVGRVVVNDPSASFRQETPAFAASVRQVGKTVSGVLVWTDPVAIPPEPYQLRWSATDVVAGPPVAYTIDPSIHPSPDSVPDGRGGQALLAAVADDAGTVSTFVANRVVVRPRRQAELDAFLARTGGSVLSSNAVPQPPPNSGVVVEPEYFTATEYTVRIDPSAADLALFGTFAAALGVSGTQRISSTLGAQLLALVAREVTEGTEVRPDFVYEGHWLRSTEERPNGSGGFTDAFATSRFATTGSRSSVTAAWQYFQARQPTPRVRVAIIDGGFWLDGNGVPLTGPGEGSDLPFGRPLQHDFHEGDANAGGENPGRCGPTTTCPWHGNNVAGVAVGELNDRQAAAGTGGLVGDPILLRIDYSSSQTNQAVRTAVAWGAGVINMSFGSSCNFWCETFEADFEFDDARARGVILVASAGNGNVDAAADNHTPCILDGVICVGALENDVTLKRVSSNFGAGVDLYAPTDVPTMPNPDSRRVLPGTCTSEADPTTCLHFASGTSTSAPFVAGVAAMMKSARPDLDTFAAEAMLRDTAWTDSGDPFVPRFLNALAAVRAAAGSTLTPDAFEDDDLATAPGVFGPGSYTDRTIDRVFDMDWHQLDLGAPADLTVTADHPLALGRMGLSVQHDVSSCGEALETGLSYVGERLTRTYQLSRGRYLLPVGGVQSAVLPYDLTIAATARSLEFDDYEFVGSSRNDSLANPFPFFGGLVPSEARAVIESLQDVDFYSMTSQGGFSHPILGTLSTRFSITTAHMPVSLQLYNAAGNLLATASSGPECDPLPYLDIPGGAHFVRVSGSGVGEYGFVLRERYVSGRLFDMRAFWRLILHPGDPVELVVREPLERFAFVVGSDGPVSDLLLVAEELHATLLDSDGRVLAEGQPYLVEDGPGGELVSLAGLGSGDTFVLELSRVDEVDFSSSAAPPAREATLVVR